MKRLTNCLKSSLSASLLGLVLLSPSAGIAGEVIKAHVDDDKGHYYLHLEMRLAAPVARVKQVLTDYDNLHRLNNNFMASRLLSSSGNQSRVLLETEGCIWLFCRRVKQVQTVTDQGRGYLALRLDPDASDMSGTALWHIRSHPRQPRATLVSYSADFVPDFWIPPIIGPWIMKKKLLFEGQETINGIEQRIRCRAC